MREELLEQFRLAVDALVAETDGGESPDFALEVSRASEHGDFACNAALVLAKRLRQPPRALAERLAESIARVSDLVERAEVAGPGFVNVWLRGARWHDLLRRVLEEGPAFGHSKQGDGEQVQVEFVSANPTGPLTLGHGRQAVLGDTIARLLIACGYDVTREYYFNNAGRQMRVLGDSVRARYLERLGLAAPPPEAALADADAAWPDEIGGLPVAFPRDGYQGAYITDLSAEMWEEHGDALVEPDDDEIFKKTAEENIFRSIRKSLDSLGLKLLKSWRNRLILNSGINLNFPTLPI